MGLKSCTADCEGPISRNYNKLASTWLVLLLNQIVLRLHWFSSLSFFWLIFQGKIFFLENKLKRDGDGNVL